MNNWKENLAEEFDLYGIPPMTKLALLAKIQSQIIEKLIEDIPEMHFYKDGFMQDSETASRIKQQLRTKWL